MNKKTIKLFIFAIIFFFATLSIYTTILKPYIHETKENYKTNNSTKVDLILSTVTSTGASVLVEDRTKLIKLANKYTIQQKHLNNWKNVDKIIPNNELSYDIEVYEFEYDSISIFTINWSNLYGSLPNGVYRIVQYEYNSGKELYSNEFQLPKQNISIPTLKTNENMERYNNVTLDALISTATPTSIRSTNYR